MLEDLSHDRSRMVVDPLVDALYTLIRTGALSPGERVDQRVISERLEVSRTPLREALRALAADGILHRTPNAGYAVAKLSAGDLLQYYSMRAFLETEVLKAITWPGPEGLTELRCSNEQCRAAVEAGSVESLVAANRSFHFTMFSWSRLTILVQEIGRVWRVSDPYRALHLSNRDRRRNVAHDHDAMIAAVEQNDAVALISLMDDHRATSRRLLQEMLDPGIPQALITLPHGASQMSTSQRETQA